MSHITLHLTARQKQIILGWHELYCDRAGRYGDGAALFPDEASIVRKLTAPGDAPLLVTDVELAHMCDWGETVTRGMAAHEEERVLARLTAARP